MPRGVVGIRPPVMLGDGVPVRGGELSGWRLLSSRAGDDFFIRRCHRAPSRPWHAASSPRAGGATAGGKPGGSAEAQEQDFLWWVLFFCLIAGEISANWQLYSRADGSPRSLTDGAFGRSASRREIWLHPPSAELPSFSRLLILPAGISRLRRQRLQRS